MTQNDLDPSRRSGRCVTDGRELDQTCRLPDSGRWHDSVGIQIHTLIRDRIPIFHESSMKPAGVLGVALRHRQTTKTQKHKNTKTPMNISHTAPAKRGLAPFPR